ncbi:MAG: phosphoglycerate mutase, partial [Candidatus Nanoarchaeia archaeon]
MKILLILDGIGDKACKALNEKTPLEAAHTPNLDALTKKGNNGYVYTVGKDIAPESDIAVLALLGHDPKKVYTGRGPLEAYGAGIPFKNGNLALRTNFATTTTNMTLLDRRAGRTLTTKEAKELSEAINNKVKLEVPFKFISTVEHRGILVLQGQLSSNISNVDPAYTKKGLFGVAGKKDNKRIQHCKALDSHAQTKNTARLVNEFVKQSYHVLNNHLINQKRKKNSLLPANII